MGKIRKFAPHVRWTEEELDRINRKYSAAPRHELTGMFPGRSLSQLQNKACSMGVFRVIPDTMSADKRREMKRNHMAKKRAENPEACRRYQLQRYHANRDENKAKIAAYQKRRFFWLRATRLDGVTPQQLASLWRVQKGKCALTGVRLDRTAQVDHKFPRAKGGGDNIENLQWVTSAANYAKRDMPQEDFLKLCQSVVGWIGERIEMVRHL